MVGLQRSTTEYQWTGGIADFSFLGRVLRAHCSICSSANAGDRANIECSGLILIARFLINGSFF